MLPAGYFLFLFFLFFFLLSLSEPELKINSASLFSEKVRAENTVRFDERLSS
jgi:hypothetical protein